MNRLVSSSTRGPAGHGIGPVVARARSNSLSTGWLRSRKRTSSTPASDRARAHSRTAATATSATAPAARAGRDRLTDREAVGEAFRPDHPALLEQLRPGGGMDGPVDTTPTHQ